MIKKSVPLLSLVAVIALIFISSKISLFKIKTQDIKITNANCVGGKELSQKINYIGQNIFLVNSSFLDDLLKKYSCIKEFKLDKKLPSHIIVNAIGRTPIAQVLIVSQNNFLSLGSDLEATPSSQSAFIIQAQQTDQASTSSKLLIDNQGYLYSNNGGNNLPQFIFLGHNIGNGERLDVNLLLNALSIIQKVKDFSLPIVKTPVIEDNYLFIASQDPNQMLFSLDSDIGKELASLQLLLQKSKMNQEQIDMIDLRFKNPIVIYLKKK